jgi:N-hydroxyarylamine O-acetyltransferase
MFDLDAYLVRIGYSGARLPTLDTLRALQERHAETIAFENLNVLMDWPVSTDVDAIQNKIVHGGRGGWCFEQNRLFSEALRAIGFQITELAARVLWAASEDAITRRSHMLLRVDLQGEIFITDVGFGGQTLTGPLRLQPDIEQPTPHEPFRIVRADADFKVQTRFGNTWKSLYRFDLQPQVAADYEVLSYFLATHPSSHFRSSLLVARPRPGLRHGLLNNHLTTHRLDGPTEKRVLRSVAEVRETLGSLFDLSLPESPDLDRAIARVCKFP